MRNSSSSFFCRNCFSTNASCPAFILRRYADSAPSISRRNRNNDSSLACSNIPAWILSSSKVKRRSRSSTSSGPGESTSSMQDCSTRNASSHNVTSSAFSACVFAATRNNSELRWKYWRNSSRPKGDGLAAEFARARPAAASFASSAASSTASVQYARLFSGLPAPRLDRP